MNTLYVASGIAGAVFLIVSMIGASWAVLRAAALTKNLELFTTANEELRAELGDERKAREDDRAKCAEALSALQGKVEVLTGDLAKGIVKAVIDIAKAGATT